MLKQLLKLAASGVALKAVRVTAMVFITSSLAQKLSPSDFGLYAYCISVASIVTVLAMVGLPTFVLREAAKLVATENKGALRSLLYTGLAKALTFPIFAVAVLVFLVFAFGSMDSRTLYTLLPAVIFLPIIEAILQTSAGITRGSGRPLWGQVPDSIIFPILFFGLIFASNWIEKISLTAYIAIIFNIISLVAAAIFSILIAIKITHTTSKNNRHTPRFYRFQSGSTAAMIYLGLYDAVTILFQNTDMVMLGTLLNEVDVGLYRVSTQFISLMILGVGVINAITMPIFAEHSKSGNKIRLNEAFQANRIIALSAAIAVMLSIVAFSHPIIILMFGEQYIGAIEPLLILGFGQLVNIGLGPVAAVLIMDGQEKEVFKAMLVALALNITLNFFLIPTYGPSGAAIATSISVVFSKLFLIFTTMRHNDLIDYVLLRKPKNAEITRTGGENSR